MNENYEINSIEKLNNIEKILDEKVQNGEISEDEKSRIEDLIIKEYGNYEEAKEFSINDFVDKVKKQYDEFVNEDGIDEDTKSDRIKLVKFAISSILLIILSLVIIIVMVNL